MYALYKSCFILYLKDKVKDKCWLLKKKKIRIELYAIWDRRVLFVLLNGCTDKLYLAEDN